MLWDSTSVSICDPLVIILLSCREILAGIQYLFLTEPPGTFSKSLWKVIKKYKNKAYCQKAKIFPCKNQDTHWRIILVLCKHRTLNCFQDILWNFYHWKTHINVFALCASISDRNFSDPVFAKRLNCSWGDWGKAIFVKICLLFLLIVNPVWGFVSEACLLRKGI